jgi:hypothetical protein
MENITILRNAFIMMAKERKQVNLSDKKYWDEIICKLENNRPLSKCGIWSADLFAKVYSEMRLPPKQYDTMFNRFFK